MEEYKLIFKHQYRDDNNDIHEIEPPYISNIRISTLYDSMIYNKENILTTLYEETLRFIKEEKNDTDK